MKIGVISDVHSNLVALRECTNYLEKIGCEEYFFLGDYVSDTPYTRETMDFLYGFLASHKCSILRGNREDYMIEQRRALKENRTEQKWLKNSASGNLLFTYEQLTKEDIDFFEGLPISFIYKKEGLPEITCCHGSPDNTRELCQLYRENSKEWLDRIDTDYMICAHTHFPGELIHNGKHYFNTGCVGISINDFGFAQCMSISDAVENGKTVWKPEFHKIPYDYKKVIEDIKSGGLLDAAGWFGNSNIQTLDTGIDHASDMVNLAIKLSKEAGETTVWPNIKEVYFEEAAKFFSIPDYRNKTSR